MPSIMIFGANHSTKSMAVSPQPPHSTGMDASAPETPESARALAARAVQRELQGAYECALEGYTKATQLFLSFARTSHGASSSAADDHKRMASRLLSRAERIKAALRHPLGARIAMEAKGNDSWAPWPQAVPKEAESARPPLSELQLRHGAAYQLCSLPVYDASRTVRGGDIRQGSVTDCSFVAALEVAAEYDARWGTGLAHGALYPKQEQMPTKSHDNVYHVKLFVDGVDRCVVVDNALPMDANGNLVCVSTCHSPVMWPALLEKAFLQAHDSGYDFQGSDAAADLYMLTGWIPEHIPLQDEQFQREKNWTRLYRAWSQGACLLSAGTGTTVDPAASSVLHALIPSHCYAILSLREDHGERLMTLANPWKVQHDSPNALFPAAQDTPAVLECRWEEFCSVFDALGVNWDTASFPYTKTYHASWDWNADAGVLPDHVESALSDQYQLELEPRSDDVLVHLERHRMHRDAPEYIALHAFLNSARTRLAHVEHGGEMGVYVDGRHTLLRLPPSAEAARYTLAVSRHGTATRPFPLYSLRVYSRAALDVHTLPTMLASRKVIEGVWRGRSAGGNMMYGHFRHNPQYRVRVHDVPGSLPRLVARLTTRAQVPVQVALVRTQERVVHLGAPTLVASSGAYTRGLALCDVQAVQPGEYTVVVSTFDPIHAEFALVIESSARMEVESVPVEGAGMYHRSGTSDSGCSTLALERATSVQLCASCDGGGVQLAVCGRDGMPLSSASSDPPAATCATLSIRMLPPGDYLLRTGPPDRCTVVDVYSAQPVALQAAP